jgi:3-hydroxyacyl-[acyl-carrier-protein] dehydratase
MHFDLVDSVIEQSADRIVTLKLVSAAEEYLQDHFATFPVLPGVMMIEAITQAARRLLESDGPLDPPMVLGSVRALKFAGFVKPGNALRVEVGVHARHDDGSVEFNAKAFVVGMPASDQAATGLVAVSGRVTLRPARVG